MILLPKIQKIKLARIACSVILAIRKINGLSNEVIVQRDGLQWNLDLTEIIDFSIFLFGGFEPVTLKLYKNIVKPGDTVLDIGANIGAHTLPLARLVGKNGRVIAFEPTRYAIGKMQKNIALNQDLIDRIFVKQMMLVADEHEDLEPEIYSSWPLFEHGKRIHPKHHGKRMDTLGAEAITLDHAAQQMRLEKVDFIKIDVDGHEYSVLSGGKELLKRFSPVIVMEMAPYVFVKSDHFNDLIYLIKGWDYKIIDADTQIELPADPEQLRLIIPDGSSRNVLLKHR